MYKFLKVFYYNLKVSLKRTRLLFAGHKRDILLKMNLAIQNKFDINLEIDRENVNFNDNLLLDFFC